MKLLWCNQNKHFGLCCDPQRFRNQLEPTGDRFPALACWSTSECKRTTLLKGTPPAPRLHIPEARFVQYGSSHFTLLNRQLSQHNCRLSHLHRSRIGPTTPHKSHSIREEWLRLIIHYICYSMIWEEKKRLWINMTRITHDVKGSLSIYIVSFLYEMF